MEQSIYHERLIRSFQQLRQYQSRPKDPNLLWRRLAYLVRALVQYPWQTVITLSSLPIQTDTLPTPPYAQDDVDTNYLVNEINVAVVPMP
jgi:hypothetical protein